MNGLPFVARLLARTVPSGAVMVSNVNVSEAKCSARPYRNSAMPLY